MELAPNFIWRGSKIELFQLNELAVGEDYVRWLNDPLVNRFLESRFVRHTVGSTREFVRSCLASPNMLLLGIRSLEPEGRHLGNIKLGPIDLHHGLGEIGLLLGERAYWGKGSGSDAIATACDIAHSHLGLRKITAGCYASNISSEKAFLKAGFEIEGRRHAHFILDGQPEDLVLMARWLR